MRASLVCVLVAAIGTMVPMVQSLADDDAVVTEVQIPSPHTFFVPPVPADPTLPPPEIDITQVSSSIYLKTDTMTFDDASGELSSNAGVEMGHYNLLNASYYNYKILTPCGNGVRDVDEQCDDGNVKDGDGCGSSCKVEGGWECASKSLSDNKQKCGPCTKDMCTVLYNGAYSCVSTKPRKPSNSTAAVASMYTRDASGFCTCSLSSCMMGDDCVAIRADDQSDGFTRDDAGKCECVSGSCNLPMAKGNNVGPVAEYCMKLTPNYAVDEDGSCVCAPKVIAVSSTDPTEARMGKNASCKVFPTEAIEKVKHGQDRFGVFECQASPYFSPVAGTLCESCDQGSCKLARDVGGTPGAAGAFTCYDNETMSKSGFLKTAAGVCECETDSCLAPDGDGLKCVELASSFPYGFVKTSSGKCGCSDVSTTCLMPTARDANGAVSAWKCLELGGANSTYGKKFVKGPDGNCQCKSTFCRKSPESDSVGELECLDISKQDTYGKGAGGWCECRSECRFSALTAGNKSSCTACPQEAGTCVAKCTQESGNRTSCQKYCVTKHMKFTNPPTVGQFDIVEHHDKITRVIECFIKKDISCDKASGPMLCIQSISAKVLSNCPGHWSEHANRNLPDGSETHGFKSVCERDDLECQLQKCDRSSFSQICLDKMMST